MKKKLFRRPSPAMVVAFVALLAALAPTATALRGTNLVSSNDIITGAVKKSEAGRDSVGNSEAREDDDKGGGFTGRQINEVTLGTVPGASGLATAATVTGSNGALVRGRAVRSARKTGMNDYSVELTRDVRTCNYVATLASNAGEITVESDSSNANAVAVHTFKSGGRPSPASFHLLVSC